MQGQINYRLSSLFMLTLAMLTLGLMVGCGSTDQEPSADQTADPVDGIAALADGWQEMTPGGDTLCSDGSAYRFYVRKGDPEKLMVYLQGGGACWTRENCDPAMQPTYSINIAPDFEPWEFGVFNTRNPDNPLADYSVVFAPYCSADVHLGQRDTVYPPVADGQVPLTIHHRGRTNMQAVLDWTYANVSKPQHVFVTGSSAGAIPSPFYASLIADQYPEAQVAQLGDGAGGYRRMNIDTRPDEQWGTFDFIRNERGFETLESADFNYEKLYIAAAKAHPGILFSEYDAAHDSVQKRFLALSGAQNVDLLEALQLNHADIRNEVANFRAFITGGNSHTILGRPEFYNYGVDGRSVRDWVADLVNFEPVDDVTCTACEADTFAGPTIPPAMQHMWASWEDRSTQYVEPFQIFDNLYYVGIDWVAAYVLKTSDGLVLIDSLYGSWIRPLVANIGKLGLNPADIKYVINTHGHFDHAGGSAFFQQAYGAKVVMTEQDWQLTEAPPENPRFYMTAPDRQLGIVASDGDVIELGDTRIELFNTPGHTEGVLTLRYQVHDGEQQHTAVTLGGVGLNFSGVERTEMYLDSYRRLQTLSDGVAVSLPNHASMGRVFERAAMLAQRQPGQPHPFVDPDGYQQSLATFIARAEEKLQAERNGTAPDPMAELTRVLSDSPADGGK